MMRRVALPLAAALLLAAPASAQDKKSSPIPSHLPVGVEACFGRSYDAAHLSAHPKQRVTSFHILRDFDPDRYLENEPRSRAELIGVDGDNGDIALRAYLRLRDRKGVYSNYFNCRRGEKGAVQCGIECDGGTFLMRPSGGSLLIDNQGFVVVGGCGGSDEDNENPVVVRPGADDKTFRLDRQPLEQCTALRDAQRPAWAKLGAPLRERFAKDGALCLVREYDAAHLASHPQQTVKRIAVLKTAAAGKPHEPPQYNLSFRAELKNGRKLEGATNCWPEDYSYACTHNAEHDTARSFYLTRAGDGVMLRDRKGSLGALFNSKLGSDDRIFRLQPSPESACKF
jgi:hypothetical protein